MRVEWDESRCAHSGLCAGLAPDVFSMGDDALLEINPELDDAQWQSVQDAADSCPTQAIILRD